ncbi:cytochrome P450 82A3-like [Malania oleifera]|uniref:cytochrome P450 82A3-like n=1 Tax=Malania oleifera TaxID=397392 RepID=UPI0025AEC574|nr:cytochrome P450 82A3-like [Malania oleifera]
MTTISDIIKRPWISKRLRHKYKQPVLLLPAPTLMNPILQFQSPLTLISSFLALFICIYFIKSKSRTACETRKRCAPQAAGAWPVIGHLHLLGGRQLLHETLGAMADKYGPIFTLRLGSHEGLVLSSWEMAKECFINHDKVFSTRPSIAASELLCYNNAMFGFAPYGSYWREMRKIAMIELLSNRRIDMLKHTRALELTTSLRELHDQVCVGDKVLVDMKLWFRNLTHNLAVRMVGGKRYFEASSTAAREGEGEALRFQEVMRNFFYLFGVFVVSDSIPYLGWVDFKGYKKAMKRTAKELDGLVEGWLEEHKQKRLLGGDQSKGEQDFMDVMLHILEGANISDFDADTVIKATCLNLILAGSDTTMVALTWALSLLLNNPQVLKRAQHELDVHVGKDRHVDESDIGNLPYLQALVKETLRLYPPTPVIALREAMEDCTLAGFDISSGTRLIINAWKIHRDERSWPEPLEFRPERFLTSHRDTDVRGQDFELIPFGSGRRSCPGTSLALQVVHLTLARLLHCYNITTPSAGSVDMTESDGLTNLKATPLDVLLTPRLNSELYM